MVVYVDKEDCPTCFINHLYEWEIFMNECNSSSSTALEKWGYDPTCAPCSSPVEYKTQEFCGSFKKGGKELYCMNSDC